MESGLQEIGDLYYDHQQTKKVPTELSADGYVIYKDTNNGKTMYVHRIVVFTFGDCNGREYSKYGTRNVIDHLDMNHENNSVENLQIVSKGINLFRAYYKTSLDNFKKMFSEYYDSLSDIDKKILDIEISLDLQGIY